MWTGQGEMWAASEGLWYLWVSRSLWWRHELAVACCRVRGTECGSACMGHFEGGHHYLHYLHHSLVSGQTTGKEHSLAHRQKVELEIYWAWPCPSEQDPVSPTVSLSHQEASINLLSFSRSQTEWNPQSQKTNQTDHMDHIMSNSMKLWAMPCRATQDGQSGEFWQKVVHWRKQWQTISEFLPWEPHEQYEKAKR